MTQIKVMKLNDLNTLVIKQIGGKDFFLTSDNSLIISVNHLSHLLKFLVFSGWMSEKVLEGILEEYYSTKGEVYFGRKAT